MAGLRTKPEAAQGLIGLIDHRLPLGVVALDFEGKVRCMNHVARAIIDNRDGLLVKDQMLAAVGQRDAVRLRRLIAAVCQRRGCGRLRAGGALGIARRSHQRIYTVLVTAVDFNGGPEVGDLGAIVFVGDPEQPVESLSTTLRTLYGLSVREVQLLSRLLAGAPIRTIAAADGIRESTARTYVKRILKKTGSRDQVDLVRRLLSGPAAP